jgi:transcriptional regulator with XRE-family HTH domain
MDLRVKFICKEKGVTLAEIASKIGVAQASLSKMLGGNPTIGTLQRIADALNVPLTDLFEEPAGDVISCPYCGGRIKVSKESETPQSIP